MKDSKDKAKEKELEGAAYAELRMMVNDFFKKDENKIQLWWLTENPILGGGIPIHMIHLGRAQKLLKIFQGDRE